MEPVSAKLANSMGLDPNSKKSDPKNSKNVGMGLTQA
jgi:hypothetical protein